MEGKLLVFLLVGRLLMFVWRKSPYSRWWVFKSDFFQQLFECDLCLGVITYLILSILVRYTFFMDQIGYIPVLSELITACSASFAMWLFVKGWNDEFRELIIQ